MDTKPISGDGVNDSIVEEIIEEINVTKALLDRVDVLIEKMKLGGCPAQQELEN